MEKIPVFLLNFDEWNTIVNRVLKPHYDYNVLADEGWYWGNDTEHLFFDVHPEYPDKWDELHLKDVLITNAKPHFATYDLLVELVNLDLMPIGNYLICVSW